MPRSMLALPLAAAVLLLVPLGASAASPANLNAGPTIGGQSVDAGATWSANSLCDSGSTTAGSVTTSFRCAFEFDLSSIPSGATVTSAVLWLRTTSATIFTVYPTDLGGYTGDGSASISDLTAGTKLLTFTPVWNSGASSANPTVTSFIAGLVTAHAGWAGFNLSSTGTNDQQDWVGPGSSFAGPPLLVVDYTAAASSPSASPVASASASASAGSAASATPTAIPVAASVIPTQPPTDVASTSNPSDTGPVITFALLAIASAVTGAVTLRTRQRSRP